MSRHRHAKKRRGLAGVGATPVVVIAATGAVALVNYAFSVVLLWLLPAQQYAVLASVAALLLMFGTVAGASAPWVLAREVAVSTPGSVRRQRALAFAAVLAAGQAAVAAVICLLIAARYADWQTTATTCGAAIVIFLASSAVGYLQGTERFHALYLLRIGEALLKITAGVLLVKLGTGIWGPVSGFAWGALLVLLGAVCYMRADASKTWQSRHASWLRGVSRDRELWSAAGAIVGIQAGTALLVAMDTVIASVMLAGRHQLATYQVVQILGRIPLFAASALAVLVFPRMARNRGARDATVAASLRVWVSVSGSAAVIMATLPGPLLTLILPAGYGNVAALLPWAVATGFSLGGINLLTTYWQAAGKSRSVLWLLLATCLCAAIADLASIRDGSTLPLARSATVTSAVGLAGLLVLVCARWPRSVRGLVRQVSVVAVPGAALVLLRSHVTAWLCAAVLGLGLPLLRSLYLYGLSLGSAERPRVLHLAFEDPLRPGSGGGSVRTQEINRRLGAHFHLTVVCARYRGCRSRTENGVRYVHIGLPWGYKLSLLSYFLFLPWALIRYPGDLVVEDFAAPFSSIAVPWLTRRPVVGIVQWLFAREKAAEYRLPFHVIERVGLASHRRLVAVSADLGAELRRRNSKAAVAVIENGLPDQAFTTRPQFRQDILYLGRLEIAQKGVDLLIQAFALIARSVGRTLTIAGSGPDELRIRELVDNLGIGDCVKFLGRIAPADRFDLLASAEIVAMPSRYETFGMVAAEALAVGTPVVAFDIPCLRSIVVRAGGIVVPPFDIAAFAAALVRLSTDERLKTELGSSGKASVGHLRWDDLALVQQRFFADVLAGN